MDLKQAIWERRSIRKFKAGKIPKNVLYQIFEAGVQAPSSCNQQMFYFITVDDDHLKRRLEKEAGFKWINRIPTPVFVIVDKRFGNEKLANIQGASAAIQNMLLYAYSLGIGSCWIAGYGDKAIVKKRLNIPSYYHILGCVGFGYANESPITPIKRDIKEMSFINQAILPLKKTNNPNDWQYAEVQGLASRTIFAKSPDIGYYHLFPLELEKQLSYISTQLGEKNLYLDDISGIYLFSLAQRNPSAQFVLVSSSQKIITWMEEKAAFHQIKNISFRYARDLKTEENTFDTVLCLDQMNRLPDKERAWMIELTFQALKSGGKLVLSFLNKRSFYGFLFRKGVARRYGPEISLSWKNIAPLLSKNQFVVLARVGFNLIPSPRLFFKMGVPGRYTFLNKYLRFFAKYDFLEAFVSDRFLARFSTTNIILAKKEKRNRET